MRQFEHDNVNRFVGLSLDGPETLSVWRYCNRGSLKARAWNFFLVFRMLLRRDRSRWIGSSCTPSFATFLKLELLCITWSSGCLRLASLTVRSAWISVFNNVSYWWSLAGLAQEEIGKQQSVQVKITFYGLDFFKQHESRPYHSEFKHSHSSNVFQNFSGRRQSWFVRRSEPERFLATSTRSLLFAQRSNTLCGDHKLVVDCNPEGPMEHQQYRRGTRR